MRAWTNASGSWGKIEFTYDEAGNRLTKLEGGVTTSYYYADLTGKSLYNQLNRTVAGTTTWYYNYNGNGDLIWKNGTSVRWNYQFNSMGQLTKVVKWTKGSGSSWSSATVGEYYYDANGARARTVEGATTVDYLFLGHDPLYDKNGTVHSKYVYVNGRLVAKLIGSDAYAYLTDALGGVWQVWKSGASSAAFSITSYKPFGIPIVSASTLNEKVRFAGEMQDSAIGLYYVFARYMDPELGRWLSLDPELGKLSAPQTLNRYVYCVNNPLRFTDPTGMWLESLFDIGCIIYDIYELQRNPTWGNVGWLLLDVGCLILPGVPALSPVLKATKWFDKANDVRKIADKGEDLLEVRNADEAIDALRKSQSGKVTLKAGDDIPAWRVYGGKSLVGGKSWTIVDPRYFSEVSYRMKSGIPDTNLATHLSEGFIKKGTVFELFRSEQLWSDRFVRYVGRGMPEIDQSAVILAKADIPMFWTGVL